MNVSAKPDLNKASVDIQAKVAYHEQDKRLVWKAATPLTEAHVAVLQRCFENPEDRDAVAALAKAARQRQLAPGAQGQLFAVPQMVLREDSGRRTLFEDQFRDVDWELARKDATLSPDQFSLPRSEKKTAVVDMDSQSRRLKADFITELQPQLTLMEHGPRNEVALLAWLARSIRLNGVLHGEKIAFLSSMVRHLREQRGLTIEELIATRFALLQAAEDKIRAHGYGCLRESFQRYLMPEMRRNLEVTPDVCFTFPAKFVYPAPRVYQGKIELGRRHYYQNIADMNEEEAQCAALIDGHPNVVFWVRNLTRPDWGFWLPTSTDRFYPDFVARLSDGRFLVVEYKGEAWLDTADTREKETIGGVWAESSNGKCVFLLVGKEDMAATLAAV